MKSSAQTVEIYLQELEKKKALIVTKLLKELRPVIDPGFEEVMNWGMITFQVPLEVFPKTYNKKPLMYCALASQKHHFSLYLMSAYADSKAYQMICEAYEEKGLKLDMGKCCLRFKNIEELDLDVIKKVVSLYNVEEWTNHYTDCRKK